MLYAHWREEIRLFRLNNPSYRAVFVLVDVLKWCLYLTAVLLLVVFCWKTINSRATVSSSNTFISSTTSESTNTSISTGDTVDANISGSVNRSVKSVNEELHAKEGLQAERLSEARIEYLKSFASRVKQQETELPAGDRKNGTSHTTADTSPEVKPPNPTATGYVVPKPAELATVIIPAATKNSDSTIEPLTTPDKDDRHVTGDNKPYKTSQWVLEQNGSHYTIQIGTTVNRAFLLRFIDSLPDEHIAALYKLRMNRANKLEYVLSYGSFASYKSATAAFEELNQSNRRYGAYIRSFDAIRRELKELDGIPVRASIHEGPLSVHSNR